MSILTDKGNSYREAHFRLEEYFHGDCYAFGLFENYNRRITRHFNLTTSGKWDGKLLNLSESVIFNDGTMDHRVWNIEKDNDGRYTGQANGIIGLARGKMKQQAFHWRYRLVLPFKNFRFAADFDDWMWCKDRTTVINRATISKFGVTIGRTWLFFQRGKPDPGFLQSITANPNKVLDKTKI